MRTPWLIALALAALLFACTPGDEPPAGPGTRGAEYGQARGVDGLPIAYDIRGAGEKAVVLVHGWSSHRGIWYRQLDPLAADYRVVTVDLAGHGASGKDRDDWSIEALAGDVAELVRQLDLDPVVLVGHSMGGPVVLAAAAQMPERVAGVVGVDTLHDVEFERPDAEWKRWLGAFEEDFAPACRRLVGSMFPEGTDETLVARTVDDICDADPDIAMALMRDLRRLDQAVLMDAVDAPIRLINADALPTDLEANRRHAVDIDVVVMEGVGHFPMIEQPEAFNAQLRAVLAEVAPPGSGHPG
jgi:pimeloyl-ACP methyl ester carboxylesterase